MTADAALDDLVRDRYAPLVGMLTLYVGDRATAEELAQDALATLVRDWDRVRTMDNPQGWLTTVAFNRARSWWRRRYAEQRARRRHGPTDVAAGPADTETALVVRSAVAQLPARQRQAVLLRYFDDRSVADTAEIMGCAPGTVKALTSQARSALRDGGLVADATHTPPAEGTDHDDRPTGHTSTSTHPAQTSQPSTEDDQP